MLLPRRLLVKKVPSVELQLYSELHNIGFLCYMDFNRIDCDFLLTIPNPAEPKLKIDGFLKSPQRANSKILLLVISIGYEIKV
jgi:hypothetical protein